MEKSITFDALQPDVAAQLLEDRGAQNTPHVERRLKSTDFLQAFQREEFVPLFQPIVDRHGAPLYYELLMRWNRTFVFAGNKMIGPQKFCATAELLGVSVDLWKYALKKSIMFLEHFAAAGVPDCRVAINISPNDLTDPEVEIEMHRMLEHFGTPARSPISLEITESCARFDGQEYFERIKRLQNAGVRFALDDFGTEYSSLSRLRMMRPDIVKIDKSFLNAVIDDARSRDILSKVVEMCHIAGALVVIEGIESRTHRDIALAAGCDAMQGFFFSVPLPQNDVFQWTQHHLSAVSNLCGTIDDVSRSASVR